MSDRRRRRGDDDEEERLLRELDAIYAEADRLYAGWSCPASTECCRFGVTGREPYVTSIELARVTKAVKRTGRPLAVADKKRRPLPIAPSERDERRCPLLDGDGRCAIYEDRPFGCRTFFCDRASPAGRVKHRDVTELVRRLKELAARHAPRGDEGLPFVRALRGRVGG
jgi:Fe-S-cluster containining protein